MAGTFIESWDHFGAEVIEPFVGLETEELIPSDVLAAIAEELLVAIEKHIDLDWWQNELEAITFRLHLESLQDEEKMHEAYDLLREIKLPSKVPDIAIVEFLEITWEMLKNEYKEAWADVFAEVVQKFIAKCGLGYRILDPFSIRPLITTEFTALYKTLCAECGPHGDLQELMESFEHAYSEMIRKGGAAKAPIFESSKYMEAAAIDFAGLKRSAKLSEAVKKLQSGKRFPHAGSIQQSISNLYGMASDYPGIRHPGTPKSKLRELESNDAKYLSLVMLAWAGYMHSVQEHGT